MLNLHSHIISADLTIKDALIILDKQGLIANVLFVIDRDKKLVGSISDGDIRRGLLNGFGIKDAVSAVMRTESRSLHMENITPQSIAKLRGQGIFFVPVIDDKRLIVDILNLHKYRIKLPVDVVMMAGGKGQRLMPLTKDTPKPLLKVGEKPIIEHNIDRLASHGVNNIYISINYLGHQLVNYFGNGQSKDLKIQYIRENDPLGTIGSVKIVSDFENEIILVMNSDLLTNIDFYEFYTTFKDQNADMAIAATSYHVDIPYAVLEADQNNIIYSLKEKPRYTYYSNAGIYIMKKSVIEHIPEAQFYDVTDLIDKLIKINKKVISFPILGYWLDIGKHEDYRKAQEDIKHLKL